MGDNCTKSKKISEQLRREILGGKFDVSRKLPSEHQLMRRFSVARETVRSAGAHVWLDSDDTFMAGRDFIMIHASSDGEKKIMLPCVCDVTEVFGQSSSLKAVKEITEHLKKGETRVYRMSDKGA